jgi:3-oxoacyl-[acyl-carrier-protein] synthase II
MNILGIGIIFARGLGVSALDNALKSGWQKPAEIDLPRVPGQKRLAYQVDLDTVKDKSLLKKIRRADKLSKMSVLAAADAIADSGIEDISQKNVGIILSTAFGAHVTTFDFLDGILDYGEVNVSPTVFSNSVHNAAASYIASSLSIKGPTVTVTQFRFSFQSALQLAQTWLDQGRCDYVLAGAADQYGDVLGYVASEKLKAAPDGKIRPFNFMSAGYTPGGGSAFFLLSKTDSGNRYCGISAAHTADNPFIKRKIDIDIIDADGMLPDESAYRQSLTQEIPAAAYSPLFGSMMISSAFNIAAGALMIKKQFLYATPVQDNPFGVRLLTESGNSPVKSVCCRGYNCYNEVIEIILNK